MDNLQVESKKKGSKMVLILLMVMMLGLIGITLYNRGNIYQMKYMFIKNETVNAKTIFKRDIDSTQKVEIITYEDKMLWISNQGIKAINLHNQVDWEINESFKKPIVTSKGKYVLVSDNNNLRLYQESKILWSKTAEGIISKIKLNKNGYVIAMVQKDSTNGQILGFNVKGQLIIKKDYIDQSYLVNVDISGDNKKVVALSITSDKSRVSSKIDIFEIKSSTDVNSKPISDISKEDTLVTDVKIFDNGNIVLVADDKIIILDSAGKNKNVKDFGESKVYRADISSGSYIVLEVNGTIKSNLLENKSREIQVLDSDGKIQGEGVKITSPVQNMNILDGYFIVEDGTSLYSISKGKLIWNYPLSKNIKYARGFKGKPHILLVYNSSIEVIEAN